jgi:hypothetical protein
LETGEEINNADELGQFANFNRLPRAQAAQGGLVNARRKLQSWA